ncbi:MAG: DUF1615 family protein [Myxococcota bacterium]
MPLLALLACDRAEPPPPPFEQRPIDEAGMARAFPADRVKDRAGWAKDLRAAFELDGIPSTHGNACATIATIEQESGYAPDPAVPGIGGMIDGWIAEKQGEMKKVPGWAFEKGLRVLLDEKPPGEDRSFYERLRAAKTERDVDLAYRAFVAHQRARLPKPLRVAEEAAQLVGLDLDDLNPITTAGCMQVKVDHAEAHARRAHGLDRDDVRDALYTRAGCVHYGAERLLGWEAGYERPVHRFADYNAGVYASRNAAFQEQVAALAGTKLALDGDLLAYADGRPVPSKTMEAVLAVAPELGEARVRRDLGKEKTRAFEETETWATVRAAYAAKTGKDPAYARLPDVKLESPKLSGNRTTAWFAENVERRYRACLARLGA